MDESKTLGPPTCPYGCEVERQVLLARIAELEAQLEDAKVSALEEIDKKVAKELVELTEKCGDYNALLLKAQKVNEDLRAQLAKAEAKADQYERDWMASKHEFGEAMAKMRSSLALVEPLVEAAIRWQEFHDGLWPIDGDTIFDERYYRTHRQDAHATLLNEARRVREAREKGEPHANSGD